MAAPLKFSRFSKFSTGGNVRSFMAVLATLTLIACTTATSGVRQDTLASTDPNVEFLVAAAASDFAAHRPPDPVQFRNVRTGYIVDANGNKQYRMCGEFLPAQDNGSAGWMRFATIRTSNYEQWLGGQANEFCNPSLLTWATGDLSALLKSRFDSVAAKQP